MKTIVALTGSFNPITIAHYKILSDAIEKVKADEGVFIITNNKYLTKKCLLKVKQPTNFILSEQQRMDMINSLSSENPKLSCWGSELGGDSPSTYKTLLKLIKDKKKQYQGEEIKLYFMFGADKLKSVPHWQNANELIELCEYLVYARKFDSEKVIFSDSFLSEHKNRIHLMNVEDEDLEDVSSTEVRRRYFNNEDYHYLMNEGPYYILKQIPISTFKPVTDEDILKANILYGGRFGLNAARLLVYKINKKLFINWNEDLLGNCDEHRLAKVYNKEFNVHINKQSKSTITNCVNEDCANVAQTLIAGGLNPAILNLASNVSPGGGYHCGSNAQEESLCQVSTLSQSLYQFGNPKYKHIKESGVKTIAGVYPMDINSGGIYSPKVTFFRYNVEKYFGLREQNFDCPVVSVASLCNCEGNDEQKYFDKDGYLTSEGKQIETNKIRTLLRIALDNGHDSMVLGAFGCGAYRLHSDEVAKLFYSVLNEEEFKDCFKKIVFAIYEGKVTTRNPYKGENGKFKPFYELFN